MNLREKDKGYEDIPRLLPHNMLPTNKDVGLCLEKYKLEGMCVKEANKAVFNDIKSIYQHASIPILSEQRILTKLNDLNNLRQSKLKDMQLKVVGKFRKKSKNGKIKVKLVDILDKLMSNQSQILRKSFIWIRNQKER